MQTWLVYMNVSKKELGEGETHTQADRYLQRNYQLGKKNPSKNGLCMKVQLAINSMSPISKPA